MEAVTIPGLRLVSELNAHAHYRERQRRAARQHEQVAPFLYRHRPPALPAIVRIVRVAPSPLDTDNLVGSAKHVRDAVARWMGVDDRSELVTWHVGQETGPYAVRILVRPWSPSVPGARVRELAAVTHLEVALAPVELAALADALRALVAHPGAHADTRITLTVGEVKLSFARTPHPNPPAPRSD